MPTISGSGETKNEHQLNKGVWTDTGAPAEPKFNVIGKRVPLKDAFRKVTGEGV
jgi:hypothetical protein